MNFKKNLKVLPIAMVLLFGQMGFGQSNDKPGVELERVIKTANSKVSEAVQLIDVEDVTSYGFENTNFKGVLNVGNPFFFYQFYPQDIIDGKFRDELMLDIIALPVYYENTLRCFMYLQYTTKDELELIGIGGRNEALYWTSLLKAKEQSYYNVLHNNINYTDYLIKDNQLMDISMTDDRDEKSLNSKKLTVESVFKDVVELSKEARDTDVK